MSLANDHRVPPRRRRLTQRVQHSGDRTRGAKGNIVSHPMTQDAHLPQRLRTHQANLRTFPVIPEAEPTTWMAEHAQVNRLEHPRPWLPETELSARLDLPAQPQTSTIPSTRT